jgi:predicted DNA-binding transcriptional regulator AlpA
MSSDTPRLSASEASSTDRAPAVAPLLLTAKQAAAACGVAPATWWRWHAAGRCPAPVGIGPGVVRWRQAELAAWTEAGCPDRRAWESLRASNNGKK